MARFAYWTILIGTSPTAFRAKEAADLVPTLKQLQRVHPDAIMKWFQRGRVWASPADAEAALRSAREHRDRRPADWRPGGAHKDPRQRFKEAKKGRWAAFRQERHDRREGARHQPSPEDARQRRGPSDRPPRKPAAGGAGGPYAGRDERREGDRQRPAARPLRKPRIGVGRAPYGSSDRRSEGAPRFGRPRAPERTRQPRETRPERPKGASRPSRAPRRPRSAQDDFPRKRRDEE
jgi:hypothetical protein